jgi:hypothetical protein
MDLCRGVNGCAVPGLWRRDTSWKWRCSAVGLVAAGGYLVAILGHGLPVLLAGWIWSASA